MSGLYIHIPACRRRCLYCSFYSVGARIFDAPAYLNALMREYETRIKEWRKRDEIETLYVGGGTPSILACEQIEQLGKIAAQYPLKEFTLEVNPEDVTADKCAAWVDAGVNRISMGIQTLDDNLLNLIGRNHDSKSAVSAMQLLHQYFDNISIDLIFGLPGQRLSSLNDTVTGFIELEPRHISAYSLTYEERSALTELRRQKRITEIDDVDSAEMYELIAEKLNSAGYAQYEISNYSQPGFESLHNSNYWRGKSYLGLGPGAHSYDGKKCRIGNTPDFKKYIKYWSQNHTDIPIDEVREIELLSNDELLEEYIITRMRTRKGIDLSDFESRFGNSELKGLIGRAQDIASRGHIHIGIDGQTLTNISLSRTGIMISDDIIVDLLP